MGLSLQTIEKGGETVTQAKERCTFWLIEPSLEGVRGGISPCEFGRSEKRQENEIDNW